MAAITELKCPYCGKTLTSTEYNHAIYEFKKRAEEYNEQRRKDIEDFEGQKQQLIDEHNRKIKIQNENNAEILEEIRTCYKQQIEDLKNSYDELAKQRQKDFDKLLDQRLAPYEEELYEKDRQIAELENALEEVCEKLFSEVDLSC
jgi:DNA repair exonuclease SbcCD ATPase subunit